MAFKEETSCNRFDSSGSQLPSFHAPYSKSYSELGAMTFLYAKHMKRHIKLHE